MDLLQPSGIPVPSTWDELLAAARAFNGTDIDGAHARCIVHVHERYDLHGHTFTAWQHEVSQHTHSP